MDEEDFFRSIYELIEVPIFHIYIDPSGDFVFGGLNSACEKVTGLCKKDVVGKRPEEISGLSKEGVAALRANCQRCLEANDVIHCDETFFGRNQGTWWLTQLAPVRDEAGKIVQIIGSSVNVTDLKRAEDSLRESELRYREVFENISDCIFILDVTPDGRFKFVEFNPAEEKSVGYSTSEVSGKFIEEAVPAELAKKVTANYRRCVETGALISYDEELSLPVGCRSFYTVLIPVRNAVGEIYRIVGVARDITERKQVEEVVRESEARYRAIVEAFDGLIYICSQDYRIEFMNKQLLERTGYDGTGELCYKVLHDLDSICPWCINNRVFAGETVHWEVKSPKDNHWYYVVNTPIYHTDGSISKQAMILDITERKQVEEALREKQNQLIEAQHIAHIGNWWHDMVTGEIYWSGEFFSILGLEPQKPTEELAIAIIHPDDLHIIQRAMDEAATGKAEHEHEFRIIRPDGGTRWIQNRWVGIYDEAGKEIKRIGTHQDITERKRAETALKESEARYIDLYENAPDMYASVNAQTASIEKCNQTLADMLGRPKEEIIGRPVFEIYHHDCQNQAKEVFQEFLERGEIHDKELQLRRKDGSKLDVSLNVTSIRGEDGQILFSRSTLRDITQRKRIDNIMQARLRLLEFANSHSMDELLTATLDEMEALTGSSIGFYHFLDADQNTLSLKSWSSNTSKNMCTAAGKGAHYDIAQAGVWVDCVYERRAVIHNDYASLPHRKGMPEGHAPVIRELVVPIFRGNLIKAIVGVGNKPADYDESDIEIVSQLGDLSWDIVERKQAEDALRDSEREKTILNQIANIFLTFPDEAMYKEVLEVVLRVMKSKFGIFGYLGENGELIIPSLSREIWNDCQVPGKSIVFPPDSWGNSLWGRAIREKKTFMSTGPFNTPAGHIHIDYFLTVPILYGEKTIGLISVANKEEEYTAEDKDLLEHIACNIAPILHARLQGDLQERRRKMAEEDLKESEEKYRLLITNADEAIFIVQDEVVKFPNPKTLKMIDYSAKELVEIPFINLVHPEEKAMVREGYLKLLKSDYSPEVIPFRIIDRKGKEIWVNLTTAKIIWEKKPGILCFLRDITIEKKLEAQFMQAQKMEAVGRLAGGVAHDFNNMLVVILGHAELALQKVSKSDPLHGKLQTIHKAAQRSADLTRQLLAFARKQTITPLVLNLNDTVSGMINMLRRLIGEDINLVWIPGEDLWSIRIDPSQIDQVLANLCINARDAITGVGKVILETSNIVLDETYCAEHTGFVPGDYILLTISDNGIGMDKETLAHLFEPFFTTKEVGKGTGLGLAMVYGIIKQNEGFINVYSELGQGSTFKLYFPRHMSKPAKFLEEKAAEKPHGGSETVLMVEDEKEILDLSKNILEELGYMVLIARTPGEAIRLVGKYSGDIHLMITDVVMPEMNGRDLAEKLASIKPGLKCLYMSGYSANIIAHRGVLEEGVHFIQKPFSTKDLAVKVRKVLDQV